MRRLAIRTLAIVALALLGAVPCAAQSDHIRTTIAVGPTWLDFAPGWGGDFGAGAGQLRFARAVSASVRLELSGLAVVPSGVAGVQPGCIPGSACEERQTPSALLGVVTSLLARLGASDLHASAGAGLLKAVDMKGAGRHSSVVGSIGLDWADHDARRLTLTLGARVAGLASPIAGMRYLVLPSVGVAF